MSVSRLAARIRRALSRRPYSLRARLVLWNMLSLMVLLGVLGVMTRALVRSLMIASVDRELMRQTDPFARPHPRPRWEWGRGGMPGWPFRALDAGLPWRFGERNDGPPPQPGPPADTGDGPRAAGEVRFDFRNGDLQGWRVVEGSFGKLVTDRHHLSTLRMPDNQPNEGYTGVVESPVFSLAGAQMSLQVGGGDGPDTYVALCTLAGKEVLKAHGPSRIGMQRVEWQAPQLVGRKVFLRLVDGSTERWGYISLAGFRAQGTIDLAATERHFAAARPRRLTPLRTAQVHPQASNAPGPPPDAAADEDRRYPMLMLDMQGRVLAPPWVATLQPWDKQAAARALKGRRQFSNVTVDGKPVRVLTRPFPEVGARRGIVQAAYGLTEVNRALRGLNRALLALAPLAILFAAVGGSLLTRRVLAPVGQMAQAAARIGAKDLSQRLPVSGKDEFGEMGAAFNEMLQRLETGFHEQQRLVEQLRRFTADASHELRTPLAIIKANADLCLQGGLPAAEQRRSLEDIERAAGSMTRLVLDLLLLAHADADKLARDRITLSIAEVVEQAAALHSRSQAAEVRLCLPKEPLWVEGSESELVRVFSNLLENALRYTPAGGTVTVTATHSGSEVRVAVADTGPGIAPEHLQHLGERFYRVDASRTRGEGGTGLGLAICRSILEAHGGRLEFESTVGVGTTATVSLPALDVGELPPD